MSKKTHLALGGPLGPFGREKIAVLPLPSASAIPYLGKKKSTEDARALLQQPKLVLGPDLGAPFWFCSVAHVTARGLSHAAGFASVVPLFWRTLLFFGGSDLLLLCKKGGDVFRVVMSTAGGGEDRELMYPYILQYLTKIYL
ncbi:hypothetical protein TNCV_224471 [Trichonephila clavipes]|nr:hypothetical protein TNCV_224471 [Trichonephila clavipes]